MLPVELSNINDLPINTNSSRVLQWFGDNPGVGDPGFQIYFVDKNAFREEKAFWVRGRSRAEILIKADRPMKRLILILTGAAVPTNVVARVQGRSQNVTVSPGQTQRLVFNLGEGFPYRGALDLDGVGVQQRRIRPAVRARKRRYALPRRQCAPDGRTS